MKFDLARKVCVVLTFWLFCFWLGWIIGVASAVLFPSVP